MHLSLSIRARLFASLLAVAVISAAGLSWYFLSQMESLGLRTLEERLSSEALVASAFVAERGLGQDRVGVEQVVERAGRCAREGGGRVSHRCTVPRGVPTNPTDRPAHPCAKMSS